jgi:glucose-1-phosphate adenylyltransferase
MATSPAGELREFQEKPEQPSPIPADPSNAYASMGNYLFNPRVLVELLEEANRNGASDFGHHIMPLLPRRHRAWAYDFSSNKIPGVRACEEHGYWRDVGTIEAYRAAQCDVLGSLPRFDLANPEWPIRRGVYRLPETAQRAKPASAAARLAGHQRFDPLRARGISRGADLTAMPAGVHAPGPGKREA